MSLVRIVKGLLSIVDNLVEGRYSGVENFFKSIPPLGPQIFQRPLYIYNPLSGHLSTPFLFSTHFTQNQRKIFVLGAKNRPFQQKPVQKVKKSHFDSIL